jgi:hypothetical protein
LIRPCTSISAGLVERVPKIANLAFDLRHW